MKAFFTIWLGELVSIIGTGMTSFALGVWVYERTESATLFAFITLAATLPAIILSPIAGAFVDRWDRRWVMILSDAGAALCTFSIALLLWQDALEIGHIYIALGIASVCGAFQQPAYQVAATVLVPKEQYASASGMMQAGMGAQFIVSPIVAGLLMGFIGITAVVIIDFVTFFAAVTALMMVDIPAPEATREGQAGKGSVRQEVIESWKYLAARPGLLGVMVVIAVGNFMVGFLVVLAGPMMLAIFDSEAVYGTTMSIAGSGMLIGSVLLGVTGGPKRLMRGLFISLVIGGLGILGMGLRPNVVLITAACFTFFLAMPFVQGCFETLMRLKVVPDMQGRIFGFSRMVVMITTTLAYVIGGPLAEYVFEPLMAKDGSLAGSVGNLIEAGPGRGIGLLLIVSGFLILVIAAIGYTYPRVRRVEEELPDVVDETKPVVEAQLAPALA